MNHLALMSGSIVLVVVVGLAIAALAQAGGSAVESIWKRRPQVVEKKGVAKANKIKAKGEACVGKILAKAEAEAVLERTRGRREMEKRVGESDILRAIALRAADVDLPEGRRPIDDTVVKVLKTKDAPDGAPGSTGPAPSPGSSLYSVPEPPPGA
jgi:hypothetical protein